MKTNNKTTKTPQPDWRAKYDSVLLLLFKIRNEPRTLFNDLCLRSEHGEKLRKIMNDNKRFEWRIVGSKKREDGVHYLFPVHAPTENAVAWVVKKKRGKYEHTINARGFKSETGYSTTLEKAKAHIEKHFELLRKENAE